MKPMLAGCVWMLAITGTVAAADKSAIDLVDVFVGGKEGYHTFRIPALVVSKKGTLLAFCEGRKNNRRDHGDIDLVLKRSSDNGKTWSKLEVVYEEGGNAKITIGNPCPVVDQDTSVIWLPFTRDNNDVFVTSSQDDGVTWSKPRRITASVKGPDWNWYATGPGNGIQLRRGKYRGRLVIPCDHRIKNGKGNIMGRSHVIYSDDHGKTWKLGGITDWEMNECAVAELADGTLLLNMRCYRGKKRRAVATSHDGGSTWSECVDSDVLIEPVCQASLIRYDDMTLLFSNPASTTTRHRLTVRLSRDGGKTWPASKLLYAGPSAYSSLAVLKDKTVGCLFERGDKIYSEKISFARFSITWIGTQN
ncbi:MAG: sialidase [Gemmatales bacterium]|nr:MAG: sialidase [Gemmatales bacterium]